MIKVNTVQADFIAWLQTQISVTSLLPSADEIREREWQGTDFTYPNIRIAVTINPNQCAPHDLEILVIVASEHKSSKQCNTIIGAIVDLIQEKSFSYGNSKFVGLKTQNISKADRGDTIIWEADIDVKGQVS